MTENEAKKYMLIEKECINRDCDRDCANCDIVQNVEDLNNAYNIAINALGKQIAKKPIAHQCTTCGSAVLPFEGNYCSKCGQKLDWSDEE